MATALKDISSEIEEDELEIEEAASAAPPRDIYAALLQVYTEVGYVQKKGRNQAQNYNYVGEEHLILALRPALIRAGIISYCSDITDVSSIEIRKQTQKGEQVTINFSATFTFTFVHAATGTFITVKARGEGADSLDKASAKAMTGAQKYALRQTTLVATGNDPDDHRSYPAANDEPDEPDPAEVAKRVAQAVLKAVHGVLPTIAEMDEAKIEATRKWLAATPPHGTMSRRDILKKADIELHDKLAGDMQAREVLLKLPAKGPAQPAADHPLIGEAKAHIQAIPGMDGATLREARNWLRLSPDGKQPTRWVLLGELDRDLRDELASAMNSRAAELGISLKETA